MADLAALATANPEPARDGLYPHRGGWGHALWCEDEPRSRDHCPCGLNDARHALSATPTAPALDVERLTDDEQLLVNRMATELIANHHKQSWTTLLPTYLLSELRSHVDKLAADGSWEHAADVANLAAMVADRWNGIRDANGVWHPTGCQCLSEGHCSIELDAALSAPAPTTEDEPRE